jgi:flagellar hook assembly protein FlgD
MVIRLGDDSGSGVGLATLPAGLTMTASPNPFTGLVRIQFTLDVKSRAKIGIYDVTGRLIRDIPSGALYPARHSFEWDGKDRNGVDVPPGVYFCRISAGGEEATGKMVLAR